MHWLAIDIGGAHLKIADGLEYAASEPFALWRRKESLVAALRTLLSSAPEADHLAITMTGELADCFVTKAEGVVTILDAVERAADGRHTRIYGSDGQLVAIRVARDRPERIASANWHALAHFASRYAGKGRGLLVDIGSTTTDLIPLLNGQPVPAGWNDTDRLVQGELVYTGVVRSPLAAVVRSLPWRGHMVSVAQELFATIGDVYLTLGKLAESPDDRQTADGRPATREAARDRLARMLCADRTTFDETDAIALSVAAWTEQVAFLREAIDRVAQRVGPPQVVVLSGRGEFLANDVLDAIEFPGERILLSDKLSARISECAPAHALAVLAREGA